MYPFFSVLLLGLVLSAGAQIEKGNLLISGMVHYSKEIDFNSFLINPSVPPDLQVSSFDGNLAVNYFITNRISIGPYLAWELQTMKFSEIIDMGPYSFEQVSDGNNTILKPGLNLRYFQPISSRIYGYVSFTGSRILINQQVQYREDTFNEKGRGFEFGLVPGIIYCLNEKWVVTLALGEISYQKYYPKDEREFFLSEFHARFDLSSFRLGAQFHLGRSNTTTD